MNITEVKERITQPLRQSTLCFLVQDDEVLLAMKKRGFGNGKWNGVGGKPNQGESIDQTAIREANEEIEIELKNIEACAVLDFYFPNNPDWSQQVVVYLSSIWDGAPVETEEMKPAWFKKDSLPLTEMWPDDKFWLPQVLDGLKVKGEFVFGEDDTIIDYNLVAVDTLVY